MLVAVSVSAAETMVSEVIAKLKDVGPTDGAQKTHWTSYPKMVDKSIMVDGLAVLSEQVMEFVGSKVCLDGNARHAIAQRSAQANKCMTKWRPVLSSLWLPRLLRLNIVKTTKWHALLWSSSVREKAVMYGTGPVVETLAQNWTSLDRKGQHERVDGHQRTYAQLGWSCCQYGLQRNLCEGLDMSRTSMVEMETATMERSGERKMV